MPIPEPEMRAWLSVFADEMPGAAAPWFGVNIHDVNLENLAEYRKRSALVVENLRRFPGVSTHFRAARDYGQRKRTLTIVRYDEVIDPDLYAEVFESDENVQAWLASGEMLEDYRWFKTYEVT